MICKCSHELTRHRDGSDGTKYPTRCLECRCLRFREATPKKPQKGRMVESICEVCGKSFQVRLTTVKAGKGQTCSRQCKGKYRTRDVAERFWEKVDKSGGPDACWPFLGFTDKAGYGQFYPKHGQSKQAQVMAYELTFGPIGKGMQGCHTCDNPPCCNPTHVFPGTHKDNAADREAKGRGGHLKRRGRPVNVGEANPNAKYTEQAVSEIKRRFLRGETSREIEAALAVPYSTIKQITSNKLWIHVEPLIPS